MNLHTQVQSSWAGWEACYECEVRGQRELQEWHFTRSKNLQAPRQLVAKEGLFLLESSCNGPLVVKNAAKNIGIHILLRINIFDFSGRYEDKGLMAYAVILF